LPFFFLIAGLLFKPEVNRFFEKNIYQDEIIFAQQTPYQKIVLTRWKDDLRLYLNNHLQFSSKDEYRYHEALALVPQVFNPYIHKVLILGGGDGLAARELLKAASIDSICIVDLDNKVTELCKNHILIKKLNNNALSNPKVKIINSDAFKYIENSSEFYDLIIADLPDPSEPALGKLYTMEFFSLVKKRLSNNGIFVTQATSPYFAKEAFWCIDKTLKALFSATLPYHVYIPSFGEWGFIMATHSPAIEKRFKYLPSAEIERYFSKINVQFIKPDLFPTFFIFSADMIADSSDILPNNLDRLKLVEYYANSWKNWNP
jgi:spermidine synthase